MRHFGLHEARKLLFEHWGYRTQAVGNGISLQTGVRDGGFVKAAWGWYKFQIGLGMLPEAIHDLAVHQHQDIGHESVHLERQLVATLQVDQ
jgi:hypothetical protein